MIHIVICDDDLIFRKQLKEMIVANFVDDYILHEFARGYELYDYIFEKGTMDIIFLDIEMPGPNGIEVGKALRSINPEVIIIVVTNYKEYVFDGYQINAYRYLIKPVTYSEIDRILKDTTQLYKKRTPSKLLRIDTKESMVFLPTHSIFFMESQNRKINIVSEDRETICYGSLSELLKELDNRHFFRCHHSFIVNLSKVVEYQKQSRLLTLKNGAKLTLSRTNIDNFYKAMAVIK